MQNDRKEVKMYSDFKSPYAFLAFDPAFALETKYRVRLKWKPFQLRLKGKGERSQYSEYKVKYSYMDAEYEQAQDDAVIDQVFGVPMFFFEREPFWGYDRMGLLEHRLAEAGLKLEQPLKQAV